MWLLVGGRGRGDRYFRGGKFVSLGAARNWHASMVQAGVVDCRRRSFLHKPDKTVHQDILYRIPQDSFWKTVCGIPDFSVLRRERMVFELLELLRKVNMQLVHECCV